MTNTTPNQNNNQSSYDILQSKINKFEILDQFDRNQVVNSLMLLNMNNRESWDLYKYAQSKGIIV